MAESKKPKDSSQKDIVDVAQPGKSAPSASSKPVIVTNRPLLKDPMVVSNNDLPEDRHPLEGESVKVSIRSGREIEAVADKGQPKERSEDLKSAEDIAEQPTTITSAEPASATAPTADTVSAPEPQPVAAPANAAEPLTTKSTISPPEEAHKDPAPLSDDKAHADEAQSIDGERPSQAQSTEEHDAETAAQAEHDAAIQKMVDSKQYFLPINSKEQRRTKRFVLLGILLSILLAVAWADIALDAGLIQINGIKAPTHFFSN